MTLKEALEVKRIYSIAGLLPEGQRLCTQRPFRAPHHTISHAGLIGGGSNPRPGEVSLAHEGTLFLDELPEFPRSVLEVLRQPIEDRQVTISRAQGNDSFPTNLMLIAAMNPCRCGYLGHPDKPYKDSRLEIERYQRRISAPLWDRLDIYIDVAPLRYAEMTQSTGDGCKRGATPTLARLDDKSLWRLIKFGALNKLSHFSKDLALLKSIKDITSFA